MFDVPLYISLPFFALLLLIQTAVFIGFSKAGFLKTLYYLFVINLIIIPFTHGLFRGELFRGVVFLSLLLITFGLLSVLGMVLFKRPYKKMIIPSIISTIIILFTASLF